MLGEDNDVYFVLAFHKRPCEYYSRHFPFRQADEARAFVAILKPRNRLHVNVSPSDRPLSPSSPPHLRTLLLEIELASRMLFSPLRMRTVITLLDLRQTWLFDRNHVAGRWNQDLGSCLPILECKLEKMFVGLD